mgnify:CR=1 FL=1
MNKVITLVFASMLLIANSSQANPNHWSHSRHHAGPGWIAPIVIGGVLGYALAQPRVVVASPPPVYYPPAPVPPYGYHYETIVDAGCNCYRTVLVPN